MKSAAKMTSKVRPRIRSPFSSSRASNSRIVAPSPSFVNSLNMAPSLALSVELASAGILPRPKAPKSDSCFPARFRISLHFRKSDWHVKLAFHFIGPGSLASLSVE